MLRNRVTITKDKPENKLAVGDLIVFVRGESKSVLMLFYKTGEGYNFLDLEHGDCYFHQSISTLEVVAAWIKQTKGAYVLESGEVTISPVPRT